MITAVNFGSIGSGNFLTGLAGLDTNALINGSVAAKKAPIFGLQQKQSQNTAQIAALKSLKGLLNTFKQLSDNLKGPLGASQVSNDAFKFKKVAVTGASNAADLVSVIADNKASKLDFTIEVTQLAENGIEVISGFTSQINDVTADSGSADYVAPGTFEINGVEITIEAGSSLVDIRDTINAETINTGATATIIQISDNEFQLQIVSNKTGQVNDVTITDDNNLFSSGSSALAITELQAATNATFIFNGDALNPIERESNVIDDLIDGLTVSLLDAEPGTELKVSIGTDTATAQTTVLNFVAAVNAIKIFYAQQNAVDPVTGAKTAGAILANDSLLNGINGKLDSLLSTSVSGLSGNLTKLSDIGFSLTLFEPDAAVPDNPDSVSGKTALYAFDQTKLGLALLNDFDAVENLFTVGLSTSKPSKLQLGISDTSTVSLQNFQISVNLAAPFGERFEIIPDDGSPSFFADFTPNGATNSTGVISGKAGTPLEGLKLNYTGDGSAETIDVDLTIGIGQKMADYLSTLTSLGNVIDQKIASLQTQNETLADEIDEINVASETLKARLVIEYSKVTAAISSANSILTFLDAQANAQNSN